jgi:hypothetical protein
MVCRDCIRERRRYDDQFRWRSFRLRRDFDVSGCSPPARTILKGLKQCGMFVADNGGDRRLSVGPDSRIRGLDELGEGRGSDFEVVRTTGPNR